MIMTAAATAVESLSEIQGPGLTGMRMRNHGARLAINASASKA